MEEGNNKNHRSNEIDYKSNIKKITETKSWIFGKINKIDKPLVILTKKRERRLK